ncbi:hypothetical protein LWC35_04850 [Pseudonocardia kujensis]|nr:hypothetical protein [Pseudonocardia kujensis]
MADALQPTRSFDVACRRVLEYLQLGVGAYVGTPIVSGDGRLFGTVCGYDPSSQPEVLRDRAGLADTGAR